MTQAVRAMERFVFMDLRLERVQICNAVTNQRSRAIPERLGYTLEGILRRHVLEGPGSQAVDHCIYGLLKPEWEAREAASASATA
jgi:ribosomal-protein-serine acetyltransferase